MRPGVPSPIPVAPLWAETSALLALPRACYSGRVSLSRLALLALLSAAAVTYVAPAQADEVHGVCGAESCDDECPSDCPPGCNDACTCCLRVRADTALSAVWIPPPLARSVDYARVAEASPASAEPDERDPVPRRA